MKKYRFVAELTKKACELIEIVDKLSQVEKVREELRS